MRSLKPHSIDKLSATFNETDVIYLIKDTWLEYLLSPYHIALLWLPLWKLEVCFGRFLSFFRDQEFLSSQTANQRSSQWGDWSRRPTFFLYWVCVSIYPVFKSKCNQQNLYCAQSIHIWLSRLVLPKSTWLTIYSCKIS